MKKFKLLCSKVCGLNSYIIKRFCAYTMTELINVETRIVNHLEN